jgi:hypothetical protein
VSVFFSNRQNRRLVGLKIFCSLEILSEESGFSLKKYTPHSTQNEHSRFLIVFFIFFTNRQTDIGYFGKSNNQGIYE